MALEKPIAELSFCTKVQKYHLNFRSLKQQVFNLEQS